MTRDLRTLIYLLNLELREECSRTLAGLESAIREQLAVEADAIGSSS